MRDVNALSLNEIAAGSAWSDRVLHEAIPALTSYKEERSDREVISDERIDAAIVHCKLALHGVVDSFALKDAAFILQARELEIKSQFDKEAEGLKAVTKAINDGLMPGVREDEFKADSASRYAAEYGMTVVNLTDSSIEFAKGSMRLAAAMQEDGVQVTVLDAGGFELEMLQRETLASALNAVDERWEQINALGFSDDSPMP